MALNPKNIVDITVNNPAVASTRLGFNVGLIMGDSTTISTGDRTAEYANLAAMTTAGFATSDAEYLAASAYFAQTNAPQKVIVGRRDSGSETFVEALTACRASSSEWYGCVITTAGDSDQAAIAAAVEAFTVPSIYIFQTSTAAVKAGTSGNIFETSKTAAYRRTMGIFSEVAHDASRLLGVGMGNVSDNAGSYFTLAFKALTGSTAVDVTETERTNILDEYGNFYATYQGASSFFENGRMFSGVFFDQVLFQDKLINELQLGVIDLKRNEKNIAYTDGGFEKIAGNMAKTLQDYADIGYIAPGTWAGTTIKTLKADDVLTTGFVVFAPKVTDATAQQKTDRATPAYNIAYIEAKGVNSVALTLTADI